MEEEANCVRCGKFRNTLESEEGRVCDDCIMGDLKKLTMKSELDDIERMKGGLERLKSAGFKFGRPIGSKDKIQRKREGYLENDKP